MVSACPPSTDRSHLKQCASTQQVTLFVPSSLSPFQTFAFQIFPRKGGGRREGRSCEYVYELNRIEEWEQMARKTIETRGGRGGNLTSFQEVNVGLRNYSINDKGSDGKIE